MTEERLDAIQARADGATKGPWGCYGDGAHEVFDAGEYSDGDRGEVVAAVIGKLSNAVFIAEAREDIPALLAEVERLRVGARRPDAPRCGRVDKARGCAYCALVTPAWGGADRLEEQDMDSMATKTAGYYYAHRDCEQCKELGATARARVEAEGAARYRCTRLTGCPGAHHSGEYVAPAPVPVQEDEQDPEATAATVNRERVRHLLQQLRCAREVLATVNEAAAAERADLQRRVEHWHEMWQDADRRPVENAAPAARTA